MAWHVHGFSGRVKSRRYKGIGTAAAAVAKALGEGLPTNLSVLNVRSDDHWDKFSVKLERGGLVFFGSFTHEVVSEFVAAYEAVS